MNTHTHDRHILHTPSPYTWKHTKHTHIHTIDTSLVRARKHTHTTNDLFLLKQEEAGNRGSWNNWETTDQVLGRESPGDKPAGTLLSVLGALIHSCENTAELQG